MSQRPDARRLLISVCLALLCAGACARAEQLPVRTYTTTDGLARDYVREIFQDSNGFIWFCTSEGLSRFDGYRFTNYGTAQGLPDRFVVNILETRGGTYWVSTAGGLALFDPEALTRRGEDGTPAPGKLFTVVPFPEGSGAEEANVVYEDALGNLWCGSELGLYKLEGARGAWRLEMAERLTGEPDASDVRKIWGDARGTLWLSTPSGLYRRDAHGNLTRFTARDGLPVDSTRAAVADGRGHLWVATIEGLAEFESAPAEGPLKLLRVYGKADGLPGDNMFALEVTAEGELWAAMGGGLARYAPQEGAGPQFVPYTATEGLADAQVISLCEDDVGNIWAGTESGGAMKIARSGILSYGPPDGLKIPRIGAFIDDAAGRFFVVAGDPYSVVLNRLAGRGFEETRLRLPPGSVMTWGWNQHTVEDRAGDWWVPTMQGLLRYAAPADGRQSLANLKPGRVYTERDGLCPEYVFRAFEDSRGDIWFGSMGTYDCLLSRWDRAAERFVRYPTAEIIRATPTAFAEDGAGNLWIGFYDGGLVRHRGGRFERFTRDDGVPAGFVSGLFLDRERRLWVATSRGGAARVDHPTSERPSFHTYTTRDGLSSDQVTCVTEDLFGRIYLGTGRGLDRLDVSTGRFKHYTTADGLASNFVNVCAADRDGSIWAGTLRGLSRLAPLQERPRPAPPVLVTALRVGGEPFPVSETGAQEVSGLTLEAGRNQLQIDYVGLSYAAGNVPRYQFRLEGADADWGAPSDQRSINFANLAPGSYRFMVRALDADGAASPRPAVVSFRVMPPFWRRWWFVLSVALVLIVVALAAQRMYAARRRERVRADAALRLSKEERLAELERVRKRIATDLHDDIGASLTQITVLSEVARQSLSREGVHSEQLGQISAVSNELVEAMSDIVWAINPKKDHLSDLVHRMRRFASDVFTARGLAFTFDAPDAARDTRLGASVRREVFLIFKESVNNVLKHASAASVRVNFRLEAGRLELVISDDGRGFEPVDSVTLSGEYEPTDGTGGNGLYSMRRRAAEMGGSYEVRSKPGEGTTVTLTLPAAPAARAENGGVPHPNGR
ncbi:MAG TPA: two-component regulator propeller domain-containing protein [Pyrinomonadaceae bacterium]|nr:two-component regulator propeller domain-containing protein [Pyrinomonadaceae bacterium]